MDGPRKLVYVAAPFAGDVDGNVAFAKKAALWAIARGAAPFVPHLMYPQFLDDDDPVQRALGIELDCLLLSKCDELWYFSRNGISSGMWQEIRFAREHGIPVVEIPDRV